MIVTWDINTTKRRANDSLNTQNSCDWSLEHYYEVARHCIGKFNIGSMACQMLKDEDAISFIAENLMYATHRWKHSPNNRTFKSYLNQCVIWGMYRWAKMLQSPSITKHATLSLNESYNSYGYNYDNDGLQRYEMCADVQTQPPGAMLHFFDILHNAKLTKKQSYCVEAICTQGQKASQIARDLGISRQAVNQCVAGGLRKLRIVLNKDI